MTLQDLAPKAARAFWTAITAASLLGAVIAGEIVCRITRHQHKESP